MLVSIVGGGGSYPPPHFGGPSVAIDFDGSILLVDCGEDCLTGLSMTGYKPCDVEEIFITHIHIDHWAGIPQLAVGKIAEGCPRLKFIGATPVVTSLSEIISRFLPRSLSYEFVRFDDYYDMNGYSVELVKMDHTVETYGLLVNDRESKLVAIMSDTRPSNEILSAIKDSMLIIFEATLPSALAEVATSSKHTTVNELLNVSRQVSSSYTIAYHLSKSSLYELRQALRVMKRKRILIGVRGLQISL